MFKALSNIEYMHAKIHMNLIGLKKLPKLKEINYKKYYNDLCNYRLREVFDVLSLVEEELMELTK